MTIRTTMPMSLRTRKLPSGFWKGSTSRKAPRRSKSTRAVKSLAPRARKAVATIAKTVMRKQTETQYIVDNPELNWTAIYGDTYPTGGATQIFACLPQIVQTDDPTSSGRRGIKIQPTKHTTDLQFVFSDEPLYGASAPGARLDSLAWDVTVHVWYGFIKRYKSTDDVNANKVFIANNLFEIDGANQTRFSGRIEDLMNERNTDFGTLKHKSFRMMKSSGNANTGTGEQYEPALTQRKLRLPWKAPQSLKYADETSFYPENYAPFILVGYHHNDGTQASNSNNAGETTNIAQLPAIKMLQVNKVWFKDA